MKHSFLCLAFLLLTATCVFSQTTKDSTWIEQFKIFRDGIYHHDKETVKQFFDFPIKGDYCWSYARMNIANDDKATDNALQKLEKNISPLTEKLFDLYFDQIFSKEFISSLIKIKTKELFQKKRNRNTRTISG
ncbi:hypothetical protein [Chitinophaga sancti]|uniref:hypothetical protein n=1 Tax=Chitinophaga sancti TaxID=1004 RepID=UPI003F79F312